MLKETGTLESKKRKETWRKIDPKKLKEYLKQYPDAYLKEIADEFGCSDVAIIKALRRLKISRKKNDVSLLNLFLLRQGALFVQSVHPGAVQRLTKVFDKFLPSC